MNESPTVLRIEVDGRVYEIACTDVELRTVLLAVEERQARREELEQLREDTRGIQLFNEAMEDIRRKLPEVREQLDRWVWEGDAAFDLPVEQVTAPWPPKQPGRYTWPEPRQGRRR